MASGSEAPPIGSAVVCTILGLAICGYATTTVGLVGPLEEASGLLLWMAGLPLLGLGLFVFRRKRWAPTMAPIQGVNRGSGRDGDVGVWMMVTIGGLALGSLGVSAVPADPSGTDYVVSRVVMGALFSLPILFALAVLRYDHRALMRLARILGVARLEDLASERVGCITGRLRGGSLSRRREYTLHESQRERLVDRGDGTVERHVDGSASSTWQEITQAPSSLELETALGDLRFVTEGAYFGSTKRRFESMNEHVGGHRTATSSSSQTRSGALVVSASPGDTVIVLGQLTPGDPPSMAAGDAPAIIFGVPADGSPRTVIWRQTLAHFGVVGLLLGLGALGLTMLLVRLP